MGMTLRKWLRKQSWSETIEHPWNHNYYENSGLKKLQPGCGFDFREFKEIGEDSVRWLDLLPWDAKKIPFSSLSFPSHFKNSIIHLLQFKIHLLGAYHTTGILPHIVDMINKTNRISALIQLTFYWWRQEQDKKKI